MRSSWPTARLAPRTCGVRDPDRRACRPASARRVPGVRSRHLQEGSVDSPVGRARPASRRPVEQPVPVADVRPPSAPLLATRARSPNTPMSTHARGGDRAARLSWKKRAACRLPHVIGGSPRARQHLTLDGQNWLRQRCIGGADPAGVPPTDRLPGNLRGVADLGRFRPSPPIPRHRIESSIWGPPPSRRGSGRLRLSTAVGADTTRQVRPSSPRVSRRAALDCTRARCRPGGSPATARRRVGAVGRAQEVIARPSARTVWPRRRRRVRTLSGGRPAPPATAGPRASRPRTRRRTSETRTDRNAASSTRG